MKIEYKINDICNYNCSYCSIMRDGKYKNFKLSYNLEELFNQFDNVKIFIYGGEPTIHPQLDEFINILSNFNKVKNIIIQTNGWKRPIYYNNKVKYNYSYHSEQTTINKFIKNIDKQSLNEIAYMDNNDKYIEYYILKRLFKNVQFCPIINADTITDDINEIATSRLKELKNKKIFNEIQNDYHFKSGNYDRWFNNNISNLNNNCYIKNQTIHSDGQYIYNCVNDLLLRQNGISIQEYKHDYKVIKCFHKYCLFDMDYWGKNYEK